MMGNSPTRRRHRHDRRHRPNPVRAHTALAASAILALAVTGLTGVTGATAAAASTGVGAQVSARVSTGVPAPDWGPCPADWTMGVPTPPELGLVYSCAVVSVPLDYDMPAGPTIALAVRRLEAGDPTAKIGTIFLNPGGPGGSGVDFVDIAWALFGPEVLARFDIVGWDPRGIARSDALSCFDSLEQFLAVVGSAPSFPMTRTELAAKKAANAAYARACADSGGPVLAHLSTANVARDLDRLRAAVGDERLNYVGISYGTQIGNTYAAMFPGRVRAVVIDSVLDPLDWSTGARWESLLPMTTRLDSHIGASGTLAEFFRLCTAAGPTGCSLAALGDPATVFAAIAARARHAPIELVIEGQVIPVSYQGIITATLSALYSTYYWSPLADVLVELAVAGGVAAAQAVPSSVHSRLGTAWSTLAFGEQSFGEGADGVICDDSVNPRWPDAWWYAGAYADREAPYFGRAWTWVSSICANWPARDNDRYLGPWTARTANGVLVVGVTHDPATDYSGALAAAANLKGSRLLALDGWGHMALGQSVCIGAHVDRYLLTGALPAQGARCTPDVQPFAPAPGADARAGDDARGEARQQARDYVIGVASAPLRRG